MKNRGLLFWKWIGVVLFLGMGWAWQWIVPATAQTTPEPDSGNLSKISFAELGESSFTLISPASFARISFPIPQDQQIRGEESYLDLHYQIFYGTDGLGVVPAEIESARFTITIEDIPVANIVPRTPTEQHIQIPIPWGAVTDPNNSSLTVRFEIFAGENCAILQPIRVVIYDDSAFNLVWDTRPLAISLGNFTQLLQRNQSVTETLSIILPEAYSSNELTAAAAVSAAIGKQTEGELLTYLQSASTVTPEQLQNHDLVIIGKPNQHSLLQEWYEEGLLPTQWLTPSVSFVVEPDGEQYQLQMVKRDAGTDWTNHSLVVEIPPFHEWQSCQPNCVPTGRLIRWDVPAQSQIFTATLQFTLLDQPILAAQTPITLSLRTEDGRILYLENSQQPVTSQNPAFLFSDQGAIPAQDGLLQLIASPYAPHHFALVVTSASDIGLIKAARALSATKPIFSPDGRLAIIRQVQAVSLPTSDTTLLPERFTLAEIGFRDAALTGLGQQLATVNFQIPVNWQLQEGATFRLRYLHANTLDGALSGLTIELNGQPIGSVPLTGASSEQTVEFALPIHDLRVGKNNSLRFLATMYVADPCAAVGTPLAWTRIRNQSELFLPHLSLSTTVTPPSLTAMLPAADLNDLVVVMPAQPEPTDLSSLNLMMNKFGAESVGFGFSPQVMLPPISPTITLTDSFVVAIGRPSANGLIGLVNDQLPQPFVAGTDMAALTIGNVVYQLPAGFSLGMIQKLPAPWNPNRPLWLITGTTSQAVQWASEVYATSPADQLVGDIILIQEEQLLSFVSGNRSILGAIEAIVTEPLQVVPATLTPTPISISPTPSSTEVGLLSTPVVVTPEMPAQYFPPSDNLPTEIKTLIFALFGVGTLFTLAGLFFNWRHTQKIK